jgi:hypothetical protein
MAEFIEFCNYRRYHKGVGNATPAYAYYGRREQILKRGKEQEQETLERQLWYNLGPAPDLARDELGSGQ